MEVTRGKPSTIASRGFEPALADLIKKDWVADMRKLREIKFIFLRC
jgi:hypothetical protein